MKHLFIIVILVFFTSNTRAQIGLGITTPHPNAYFQINSTNKGVLLPRMTALQRLAIAPTATANGLIVFDTDSSAYMFWTGTLWRKIGGDDGNWVKNGNDIYNSNTGNVGIGTSTPNSPLSFADAVGNKISLWGSSSASNYGLGVQGSLLQLYVPGTTDNIAFGTGGSNSFTERMRIQGNGNVGIGNTDPAFPLDISNRMRIRSGGSNASTAGIWLNNNANSALTGFVGMESDNAIGFYGTGTPNGWGVVMNIATGNVGIGTSIPSQKLHVIGNILATGTITPSDIRYKTNIHPIQNSLHKLVALNGVTYLMNRVAHPEWQFDSTMQYGLIAQEVEKIFPEIVSTINADGYKGIDYVKLVPVLIEGVKELEAKNSFLKNENIDIKKRLEQLEAKLNLLLQNSTIAKQ